MRNRKRPFALCVTMLHDVPPPPRPRAQVPIPKKRAGNVAHDKALQKFYRATYEALLRHINFAQVKLDCGGRCTGCADRTMVLK